MPQICFNLSLESQQNFETKANRISRQSKLESLTKNLDLFMFEIYTHEKKNETIIKLYNSVLL